MSTSFLKKLEEFYKSGISTCCIERVTDSERLYITFGDSFGHTFYAITDGSYLLQTEDFAEIRGEAYMIRDGRIEQICNNGAVYRL